MNPLKSEFVELCVASEALRFGEFKLKSGRVSPYFFNAGLFNRGRLLGQLARCYARLIAARINPPFMLYGPAYKGIPLAAATAVKLFDDHGMDVGYAFHRKEVKDHGEGGGLVGARLAGDVVIIDDVITAGLSIRQSVAAIKAAGAVPHSVVIALDRQEIVDTQAGNAADNAADNPALSAAQHVEKEHGIPVYSLINLRDLTEYLGNEESAGCFRQSHADAINAYRDKYGAA